MDYFSLCLSVLCLTGQSVMHIAFIGRLTGKKPGFRHFSVYFSLLCILDWFFTENALPNAAAVATQLLISYDINRIALGSPRPASLIASIFAIYISQLSFGIMNSAEAVLFPNLIGKALLYPLLLLATLSAFVICACCYAATLKFLSLAEVCQTPWNGVLLLPGLFFFAAEWYILCTSYSRIPSSLSHGAVVEHGALMFLQVLGLAALLCTLYAWQQLCRSLQIQTAFQSLAQAAQAQKIYIAEAQARYEQTRAFRHDIKNHLAVLNGLLNHEKWDESKAYLKKLETVTSSLSFPWQTGNPVVDILLGEKLGLAKTNGITSEVSLLLPHSHKIDDFDLCVIFANALDNAVAACQDSKGAPSIRITGKQQGDFYMLGFENTCSYEPLPPAGTGLANIRAVAEKYHGAVLTEKTGQLFSLSVLLNISLHPESISIPTN